MAEAAPWAFIVIGGPILLGLAILAGRLRSRKTDRERGAGPADQN